MTPFLVLGGPVPGTRLSRTCTYHKDDDKNDHKNDDKNDDNSDDKKDDEKDYIKP